MDKNKSNIKIGTSGWHYRHWAGLFYPSDLPRSRWFDYYARDFDTVEINNTFYQLPKQQTLKNWYEQAPQDFIYSVKANRYITHIKRLKEASGPLERFFETVGQLKSKLGPVLYQLPPNFHKDLNRLGGFIELLPSRRLAAGNHRQNNLYSISWADKQHKPRAHGW